MIRLLVIDNFDSFVYNLVQAFGALGAEPVVVRNDATIADLEVLQPDAVCISPGPGAPSDAGISTDAIRHFATKMPLLGVCLGHQCIAEAFGAKVTRADAGPVHGKTSAITHDGKGVFAGIDSPFTATRYHSLAVQVTDLPEDLEATAHSKDGIMMGLRHRQLSVEGVQFHPESILTPDGPLLLRNFLDEAIARAGSLGVRG